MTEYKFNNISPSQYVQLIQSRNISPCFRLSILNYDESIRMDISEYLVDGSGSLSVSYAQGQRRSLSFELYNDNGMFTPNAINGLIWINTKIKLELGIQLLNGDVIYNSAGIFVLGNPQSIRQDARKTISFQCYDKFALLDGTLGGIIEVTTIVKQGERVIDVIRETLLQDNGNMQPIDPIPIVFDTNLSDAITEYELSKEPNDSFGSILIALANMLSADIWYGINGNLIIQSGIQDISNINKQVLWKYSDKEYEYLESSINYDFTSVKNDVTVVGTNNNNNEVFTGHAENNNPQSPTRVNIIGRKRYYLEDANIYSTELAQQRAEYELKNLSILANTININSTYLINLDVNQCISITDNYYSYFNDKFLIQSFSIPLSIDGVIDINCTNIASLPFYY